MRDAEFERTAGQCWGRLGNVEADKTWRNSFKSTQAAIEVGELHKLSRRSALDKGLASTRTPDPDRVGRQTIFPATWWPPNHIVDHGGTAHEEQTSS